MIEPIITRHVFHVFIPFSLFQYSIPGAKHQVFFPGSVYLGSISMWIFDAILANYKNMLTTINM